MTEIELVIKIPEEEYKIIKNHTGPMLWVEHLIKKGTLLPKGHWIEHPHEWGDNWQNSRYECSCCHDWAFLDTDYCPNCGAEMSEGEGMTTVYCDHDDCYNNDDGICALDTISMSGRMTGGGWLTLCDDYQEINREDFERQERGEEPEI